MQQSHKVFIFQPASVNRCWYRQKDGSDQRGWYSGLARAGQIHEAAGLVIAANQRSDDIRLTQSSDQFGSRSWTRLPTHAARHMATDQPGI